MSGAKKSLYERLGGYDAITAVANDLLPRLQADPQLGRFWAHCGEDGVARERQLLIDFLCASAGGGAVPSRVEKRNGTFFRLVKCTPSRPPWQAATGGTRHGEAYQQVGGSAWA